MSANVIPPLTIDGTNLTSTTVAEPHSTETAYSGSAVYKAGDRRISTSTHRVYESLEGTAATVTLPIASPGVVTWANHGLAAGTPIAFTNSGGALPTGLVSGTVYYVLAPLLNTFNVAATVGGAAINFTGSQSGTHTATANPNIGRALTDKAWWADVGPTNKWAMFDLDRNTATTDASPLTVVITPGQRVDAIGLVGMDASEVEITVDAGSPLAEVYSYTLDLTTREVGSWYDYFFAPFRVQPSLVLFDLPPYISAVITVELTRGGGGNVSIAGVVLGQAQYLGEVEHQAVDDAVNFSEINRDEISGEAELVRRRSVPKGSLEIWTPKTNVNRVRQLREDLNAVPALWAGLPDAAHAYFESVLKLGIYTRFTIGLDQPEEAKILLDLEEI